MGVAFEDHKNDKKVGPVVGSEMSVGNAVSSSQDIFLVRGEKCRE